MGYDVGASILQGWKLNDFFEGYCEDEMTFIRNVFEDHYDNEDEKNWIPFEEQEGVGVDCPDSEKEEYYIGLSVSGVSNRDGPRESIFELRNPVLVKMTIIRVMRKPDLPMFNLIADMMENRPTKNYLLLSESY